MTTHTEHTSTDTQSLPFVQRISSVLWPSFIVAGVAMSLFFTAFDPAELTACFGLPPVGRLGTYSIGFFLFWLTTATSSLLTQYFLRPCDLINPAPRQD